MVTPLVSFGLVETMPLLGEWQRWHWRKRGEFMKRLSWEIAAAVPANVRLSPPIERCLVVIERRTSRPPMPDWDNVVASGKPLMDCLVTPSRRNPHGLNIIADDNPQCVGMLLIFPGLRQPGEPGTIVRIYQDTDEAVAHLCALLADQIAATRGLAT